MPAMTNRQMMPGIRPNVSNAEGIDRTPRPIMVFIRRATVPIQPTYKYKNRQSWCH